MKTFQKVLSQVWRVAPLSSLPLYVRHFNPESRFTWKIFLCDLRRYNWGYSDGLQSGPHHGLYGLRSAGRCEEVYSTVEHSDDFSGQERHEMQLVACTSVSFDISATQLDTQQPFAQTIISIRC